MKSFVALAFAGHALLMPLCMVPMAMAADMPAEREVQAVEMIMTPMVPMSPVHPEHYASLSAMQSDPVSGTCGGHCLSRVHDVLVTPSTGSRSDVAGAALSAPAPVLLAFEQFARMRGQAEWPPGQSVALRTIVLLQ